MKSPVAHWGSREWRKNMDDLVPDPAHPQAFPFEVPDGPDGQDPGQALRRGREPGRVRVRRPAGRAARQVGGRRDHGQFVPRRAVSRTTPRCSCSTTSEQILLRADGMWETYGEVQKVCHAAKVPSPKHLVTTAEAAF